MKCSAVQWIREMNGLMGLRSKDKDGKIITFYKRNRQQYLIEQRKGILQNQSPGVGKRMFYNPGEK